MPQQPLYGPQINRGGLRPEDLARLQLAQQLIKSGTDTSPVESPWQGLARVAQAGVGGYMNYRFGEDQKQRQAETSNAMANALRAQQSAWPDPDNPGQSMPIPGAQGGQAGVIASLLGSNSPDAQQYGTQLQFSQIAEAQKAAAARSLELLKKGMEDDGRGGARKITNYGTAQGEIDAEKLTATIPAKIAEIRAMAIPEAEKQALIEAATNPYKLQRAQASAPRVNVSMGKKFGEGLAENAVSATAESKKSAVAARDTLDTIALQEKFLNTDAGIITGKGAELELGARKVLDKLGLVDSNAKITATESFQQAGAKMAQSMIKQFGANPTDRDLIFANKLAAGEIEMNKDTLANVVRINKRLAIARINDHNSTVEHLMKTPGEEFQLPATQHFLKGNLVPIREPVVVPGLQPQQGGGFSIRQID